jgi:hypothetical protein
MQSSGAAISPHADELRPLLRLDLFQRQHQAVGIHHGDGFWQAVIPPGVIHADSSTHIITRYDLTELLDEIDTRLSD